MLIWLSVLYAPLGWADIITKELAKMQECVLNQCVVPTDVTVKMIRQCLKDDTVLTPDLYNVSFVAQSNTLKLIVVRPGRPPNNVLYMYGNCFKDCTVPDIVKASTEILQKAEEYPIEIGGDCEANDDKLNCVKNCAPGLGKVNRAQYSLEPLGALFSGACAECPPGYRVDEKSGWCLDKDGCEPLQEKNQHATFNPSTDDDDLIEDDGCVKRCHPGWIRSTHNSDCVLKNLKKAQGKKEQLINLAIEMRSRLLALGSVGECDKAYPSLVFQSFDGIMDDLNRGVPEEINIRPHTYFGIYVGMCLGEFGPNRGDYFALQNDFMNRWSQIVWEP